MICIGGCYHFRLQFYDLYQGLKREEEVIDSINLDYWKKKNPDVYAWIRIPGTNIDYPILQSSDMEEGYYLTHDIDRESNIYGALYTEKYNSRDFRDSNTIIYGHNMNDGSMFGSLKKFIETDYFTKHDMLTIFTMEEKRTYTITAAYRYQAEHLPTYFDFSTKEGTDTYLSEIPGFVQNTNGNIRSDIEIQAPLLTLSTCTPDNENMRYLVQAVLVKTEKVS